MNAGTILVALAALLLVSSSVFAVDVGDRHRPSPVPFDDTIPLGSTGVSLMEAESLDVSVPRAQVFFSQYRFVVGYYGVTWLVDDLQRPDTTQQFGRPLVVYVTDYADTDVELTEQGYIRLPDHPAGYEDWVPVEAATFVVGSRARTPSGPAVPAFSNVDDARNFAARYGGRLEPWSAIRTMNFGTASATRTGLDAARQARQDWANRTVADARTLLDRPVSVTVGEDAPTLAAAIDAAPPNTTIALPPGRYAGNVTIRKPLTIRGVGPATHVVGTGTDSVLTARADHVAIADLRISGVGNTTSVSDVPGNTSDWDARVQQAYAFGNAGVVFHRANGSLVQGVTIDTPANGVVFRWSDRSVAHDVTVNGSQEWTAGFMGVMDMASRVVVQDSTFTGGRDGVYTHRAHGIVVRDNRMTDLRFGVHEMYTSDALVANNTVRRADVGVIVMTRPTGNLVVGNDVRDSDVGTSVIGSASWITANTFADNRIGMYVSARRSRYERNVVVRNEVGIRASSIIPTAQVTANDVVDNDRAVLGILGPLRICRGNYWDGAPGRDRDGDGTLDRAYQPTGPVDGRVGQTPGAETLAHSPALVALRELQSFVPGLRGTGVIDPEPRADPVRPATLDALNASTQP